MKPVARTQLPLFDGGDTGWRPPAELPRLPRKGRLSFDTETRDDHLNELGPGVRRGGYVVGVSVGTEDGRRFYLPTRHEGGGNLDERMVQRWARDELNTFEGELVGAHLLYDLDYMTHDDWKVTFPNVKRFRDVQVAEPLIDENRDFFALDHLAHDYLGERKDETELKAAAAAWGFGTTNKAIKSNLWRLPAWHVGRYGEADADLPLRILPLQEAKLQAEGLMDIWDVESRLIPLLLAMRRRGVRVDVRQAEIVRRELVKKRDEWLAEVRRHCGPRAELMAPMSLADGFRKLGVVIPTTRDGNPSITKPWLEKLKDTGDPLAKAVFEGRALNTVISTFIDGHIFKHAINGRIHCEFVQLKSDDGGTIARLASRNPNLQNLPARDDYTGPLIRSCFIPEDGEEWVRHDMSQIEFRLLAHYAKGQGAVEAREAYTNDPETDFHNMAAGFMGVDGKDKFKRKRVKNLNFGKVYGGGIPKLAATFNCSIEEAEAFDKEYDRKLPFVNETYNAFQKRARERGYIITVGGRRQRFPFWESRDNFKVPLAYRKAPVRDIELAREMWPNKQIVRAYAYTALNKGLQCSAADFMKKAMAEIWESGVCDVIGAPLLTVHDELDDSVPRTAAGEEAVQEIKRLMESSYKLRVPLIADIERGNTWGEAS